MLQRSLSGAPWRGISFSALEGIVGSTNEKVCGVAGSFAPPPSNDVMPSEALKGPSGALKGEVQLQGSQDSFVRRDQIEFSNDHPLLLSALHFIEVPC